MHVALVDATVAEAVAGQDRRGRSLGRRRMARHARRWPRLRAAGTPLAASSVVLPRAAARLVSGVVVAAPAAALGLGRDRRQHPAYDDDVTAGPDHEQPVGAAGGAGEVRPALGAHA